MFGVSEYLVICLGVRVHYEVNLHFGIMALCSENQLVVLDH